MAYMVMAHGLRNRLSIHCALTLRRRYTGYAPTDCALTIHRLHLTLHCLQTDCTVTAHPLYAGQEWAVTGPLMVTAAEADGTAHYQP